MLSYYLCQINTVKPIIKINRVTNNGAIESIENFRNLGSICNYFPFSFNSILFPTTL